MADFVTTLVVVSGPAPSLDAFCRAHLVGGTLDFHTIRPMPPELDIEADSATETGYAALYGDWQSVAGYWMFKESAQQFGFPFPLASRDQVIRSLQSFDCADMYLQPAQQYHDNMQRHGHGDWYGWCLEHWGTKWNAGDVVVAQAPDSVAFRFVTATAYPKPVMKALSTAFADLAFHVRYVDEHHRWGRQFTLVKGRETKKVKRAATELAAEVHGWQP